MNLCAPVVIASVMTVTRKELSLAQDDSSWPRLKFLFAPGALPYGSNINGFTPRAICPLMVWLNAVKSTYFVYPAGAVYSDVVHTPLLHVCDVSQTIRFFPTAHDQIFPADVHGSGVCPVNHVSTTSYAFPALLGAPAVVSIVPELLCPQRYQSWNAILFVAASPACRIS
jgi:hypothetical protein